MASARRGRVKTGSGQVPGYGRNYGPTRERPLPTVEGTYARIKHVPRQDDVYTMLNDDRQTAQEQPIPTRERPAGGSVVSQGPRGLPYETGSGNNHRSGRLENTNKIRLVIGVSICTIVVGLALSGAALWFFLKGDDTYPVTYEVKVTLPNAKFVENMKKTDSAEFTDMKKKYCEAVKSVFGGTLLNCAVDQLSNGSVIVLSALEFDWNELTDSVKKNNKLPVRQNIYEYIKEKIEDSDVKFLKDAKASTQVVPETVDYTLKLHLKGMNWTDDLNKPSSSMYKKTATDYCDAMKEAFKDTMNSNGCKVKKFTEGSVVVESELSFNTTQMKKKAKADGGSVDLFHLGSVVQKELKKAATKMPFFKDNDLDAENITVKSETIEAPPTTTTTATTTTTLAATTTIVALANTGSTATTAPETNATSNNSDDIIAAPTTRNNSDDNSTAATGPEITATDPTDPTTTATLS